MSMNEVLGISDGMYDDGNIQYLKSPCRIKKLKKYAINYSPADMATTRIEYELNMKLEREEEQKTKQKC